MLTRPDPVPRPDIDDAVILIVAAEAVRTEARALDVLADRMPAALPEAVKVILATTGRVVVSGIGKSGHVARKIAATLASTGTRSFFVHPSEASHGDLGMVGANDALLLISNSGETAELRDLITHARRWCIPLIGLSQRAQSTLMRAADVQLVLPPAPEACPLGLAPTTSTTMTMSLGDALAVALMSARGFAPENFRDFHPGGKLGAKLARVDSLMHGAERLPLVQEMTSMADTLLVMTSAGFGIAIVVTKDGTLTGVVTDGDLRRHIDGLMTYSAGHVATRDPVHVAPDARASDALAIMTASKITALPVVDHENRPVGVLHVHDLLRAGVASND